MKTTTASVFLLFVFSITQSSFLFGLAKDAVLDSKGNEVVVGAKYHVVSGIYSAAGGGLAIGSESDRQCPEIVVEKKRDVDLGDPVIFSKANTSDEDNVVRESTGLIIKFDESGDRLCDTSTRWKLQDYDGSTGKLWLELGGSDADDGWFEIEAARFSGTYNFKLCPKDPNHHEVSCFKINRAKDSDGQMRLTLSHSETAWPWQFVKVKEPSTRIRQVVNA